MHAVSSYHMFYRLWWSASRRRSGFGWYFYKHPCILTAFWSLCGGRPSEEKTTRVFLGLPPNSTQPVQCLYFSLSSTSPSLLPQKPPRSPGEAGLQPNLESCSRILVASASWLFSHAGARCCIYQGQIMNCQSPFWIGCVVFFFSFRKWKRWRKGLWCLRFCSAFATRGGCLGTREERVMQTKQMHFWDELGLPFS